MPLQFKLRACWRPGFISLGGPFCPPSGNNIIGGSVSITNNDATSLSVMFNTVSKNMTVSGNVGTGQKTVAGNTVTGNLECFANAQPFSLGYTGNTSLKGKLTGQCAQ